MRDSAIITQYPDESEGKWVPKKRAMEVLNKSSGAFDTHVFRCKVNNRPITNDHIRNKMNDPKRLYFITHAEELLHRESAKKSNDATTLQKEIVRILAEREPSSKQNVRKVDDSASVKLENNYKEQIAKLEKRNKDLEERNNVLNSTLLIASENVSNKMVELTKGLLQEKMEAVELKNKEIQILSLEAGKVSILEELNQELIRREEELKQLLPKLMSRLK